MRQVAAIPGMWFRLFVRGPAVPHRRRGLLSMAFRLCWLAPRYLMTRKRSHATFPIRGFDYELRRDGAFFAYPRTSMAKDAGYPLATVIVRTYQGRMGFLREATRSIVRQTYPNVELVVVEDGETGFAREYVESLAEPGRLATRYIANPKGERARAGNAALAAATGKYIMFLDDDDLIFADHLEVLVETLCRKPELGAAYANAWEVETIVHSTEPLRYTETLHKAVFRQPFCRPLMWVRNFIPIQAIVFDRRLYERHGGFDIECPPLEDWNLWTRYCAYDDFVYVEKTTSMYRTPADADERARRQGVLDVTYARAVSRQDVLSFQLTPQQFLELHRELNRYEHADFGTYHQVKAMFKRNALGMWVVRRAKLAARLLLGKEGA
jgi:glycosyltransferase involved in cell wall biosynthesis